MRLVCWFIFGQGLLSRCVFSLSSTACVSHGVAVFEMAPKQDSHNIIPRYSIRSSIAKSGSVRIKYKVN